MRTKEKNIENNATKPVKEKSKVSKWSAFSITTEKLTSPSSKFSFPNDAKNILFRVKP